MARAKLWEESETRKVECEYGQNPLFTALRSAALQGSSTHRQFAWTAGELFYHTLYNLDMLRGMGQKEERMRYAEELWDETYRYITDRVDADVDEQALKTGASLAVTALGCCLSAIDHLRYFDEMLALFAAVQRHTPHRAQALLRTLAAVEGADTQQAAATWLQAYWQGTSFLSDDIEDLVRQLRAEREEQQLRRDAARSAGVAYINSTHNDYSHHLNATIQTPEMNPNKLIEPLQNTES